MGIVMGGMAQPKELETDGAQLKDAGNAAFKVGNWEEALSCYTKALDLNIEDAEKAAVLKNRAAVHLKQEQWKLAEKDCTAALELAPQDPKALYRKANAVELDSIMHVVCFNVTSRTITPIAREALINLIMKNCKWEQLNWAERMFKTDAYHRLMEVASVVNMPEYKYESSIDITDSTKTIVGVTFGHLYEQMYDDKRRAQLVEVVSKYTEQQLLDPSMESKVRVVVGITTLLTNAPELGNSQLKDGLLEMAQSDDYIQQLVASEAIIAAASKKKDVTAIVKQGLDIVKSLYKCNNDHIKVRALVGLCKLGASGGSD